MWFVGLSWIGLSCRRGRLSNLLCVGRKRISLTSSLIESRGGSSILASTTLHIQLRTRYIFFILMKVDQHLPYIYAVQRAVGEPKSFLWYCLNFLHEQNGLVLARISNLEDIPNSECNKSSRFARFTRFTYKYPNVNLIKTSCSFSAAELVLTSAK